MASADESPERGSENSHQRIRRRLEDDLQIANADVDGVMAIIEEEVEPVDYVLDEGASFEVCEPCGRSLESGAWEQYTPAGETDG